MDILHLGEPNPIPNLFIWIVSIFFNVAMQEIMVRGYMFSLLKREYNVSLAVIVTSVIFTAMHGGAFEAGAVAVLNVFTTSILLSVLLILSNGLLLPILMHFMWNMLGSLLGIVSLASDYPSLYTSTISGNNILSGGNAGIEGSIIVLIINLLILFGLFIYLKTKKAHSKF
ncbi:MAG: lysostaphin resistance A-like protein [Turicibacter sp.]